LLPQNTQSFLIILLVAAIAPIIAGVVGNKFRNVVLPVVVVELLLGIVIGPELLKIAHTDDLLDTFSQFGLGFLFFFAGYEIRIDRIKGTPLKLALYGWLISLVMAYSIAAGMEAVGIVVSGLLTGSALVTTAIGTLVPVLNDENKLGGKFGTNILAIGAIGEFGPVLIVTILLSATDGAPEQIGLLALFIAVAVIAGVLSTGATTRYFNFIYSRMDQSGQLPVRLTVLLLFSLVIIAGDLGMDVILGAFAAGMIMGLIIGDRDAHAFESKLEAVGFGFLIPFFFIISGMNVDMSALFGSVHAFLKLPLFFLLMLLVRGVPAFLLYAKELPKNDRWPLALLSATQLPLVVAITSIGLDTGKMRPSTAAALVSAAVLTVLVFHPFRWH
jgi:Kef-type K+ transport system membrane component KefB